MAFVALPAAEVTFGLLDETGSKGTLQVNVPGATLIADAQTAADGLRALIEAITGCAVVSQSITFTQIDDAQPAPAVGSRVEQKGVFVFRTAAGKTVTYQVPGIAVGVKDTGQIDEDNAAIAAFVTGLNDAAAIFSDSNGQALAGLVKAYERYRRSTRAMLPSKKEPDADAVAET